MTYDKFRHRYDKIVTMLQLNTNHRPHDARKHFVTMAKRCNMDEYALKYIIGHEISDITEKVYTERNIDWLKTEMQKKIESKKGGMSFQTALYNPIKMDKYDGQIMVK